MKRQIFILVLTGFLSKYVFGQINEREMGLWWKMQSCGFAAEITLKNVKF